MKKIKQLIILLFFLNFSYSQDGTLDLSFNNPVHLNNPAYNGFSSSSSSGGAEIFTTKILNNGKIAVYGDFDLYQGITTNKLAILNPNGSLDTSFNVGLGPDDVDRYNGSSSMICEQSDGKLIVVGNFTTFNGVSKKNIVRLNLDGTIDTSFNVGTATNGYIACVKIQSDGKILCGGEFTQFNGQNYASMVRLNSNGTIDTSFNIGLGFKSIINSFTEDGIIKSIDIQSDNKIIVGGKFLKFNNVTKINLVRLNANGSLDTSFNIGIGAGSNISDNTNNGQICKLICESSTNKIYITGTISSFNGNTCINLLRLNNDGTIDSTFNYTSVIGYNGLNSNGYIYDMNLQSNGKLLLGGEEISLGNCTGNYCNSLVQINSNGTIDNTFKCNFVGAYTNIYSIDSFNDFIIVSGQFTSVNYTPIRKGSIVKIKQDGLTDLSFNPNLGDNNDVPNFGASTYLNDGTIILNPSRSTNYIYPNGNTNGIYNERLTAGLIKINPNGTIVENEYNNFLSTDTSASCLTKDNSSNLIASVAMTKKIQQNGLIDNTFTATNPIIAPNFVNIFVYDHAVQNDNKIIIGGNFRYTFLGNTSYRQRIMRVNSNGTLDTSFNVGKGFNGTSVAGTEGYQVNSIQIIPNNKCIIGGSFTKYKDTDANSIICLNDNGSIDNTFNMGTGFNNEVRSIRYQSNLNKIIVVGKFTTYNTVNSNYIIRLNLDGTNDTTFTSPFNLESNDSRITNIEVQSDGKYLITGVFSNEIFIKRLNPNGSIDLTFYNNIITPLTYPYVSFTSDPIKNLSILPNNKILISGHFTHIDGVRRNGVAVLNNSSSMLTSQNFNDNLANDINIIPNPVIDKFKINTNYDEISIYTIDGKLIKKLIKNDEEIDISELNSNIYFLKIKINDSYYYKKIIKK